MNDNDSKVEALLSQQQWHHERKRLRAIALSCQLTESVKWGKLCYSVQDGNVAMIFGMKDYCALGFFKGSLLKDPERILVAPGEHSQAMRQARFTQLSEIESQAAVLEAYLHEAIELEKAGAKVEGVPVFHTVADAVKATGANATVVYVPPAFSAPICTASGSLARRHFSAAPPRPSATWRRCSWRWIPPTGSGGSARGCCSTVSTWRAASGSSALTVALVPTGMKTGVSTAP